MKAVVYQTYGPPQVLQLTEMEKPKPKAHEVLVKVHATTVTSGDTRLRSSDFPPLFWLPARILFGLWKPRKKILGHEWSGTVEAIGEKVTRFNVGDAVFGTTTMLRAGSYAEYVCIPQTWKSGVIERKPGNLDFAEAAALPIGAMTAMYLWEKAHLKEGQKVVVYGASGSVGSYAVQIAHQQGAAVTAVCRSPNFDMVRSLGAEDLIDYTQKDYWQDGESFDIVFDAVGKTSKAKAKKVLRPGGSYVSVNMLTQERSEHLERIKQMAEQKRLKPFLDRSFSLDEIVEAHQYVDQGRKRGNVVIRVLP